MELSNLTESLYFWHLQSTIGNLSENFSEEKIYQYFSRLGYNLQNVLVAVAKAKTFFETDNHQHSKSGYLYLTARLLDIVESSKPKESRVELAKRVVHVNPEALSAPKPMSILYADFRNNSWDKTRNALAHFKQHAETFALAITFDRVVTSTYDNDLPDCVLGINFTAQPVSSDETNFYDDLMAKNELKSLTFQYIIEKDHPFYHLKDAAQNLIELQFINTRVDADIFSELLTLGFPNLESLVIREKDYGKKDSLFKYLDGVDMNVRLPKLLKLCIYSYMTTEDMKFLEIWFSHLKKDQTFHTLELGTSDHRMLFQRIINSFFFRTNIDRRPIFLKLDINDDNAFIEKVVSDLITHTHRKLRLKRTMFVEITGGEIDLDEQMLNKIMVNGRTSLFFLNASEYYFGTQYHHIFKAKQVLRYEEIAKRNGYLRILHEFLVVFDEKNFKLTKALFPDSEINNTKFLEMGITDDFDFLLQDVPPPLLRQCFNLSLTPLLHPNDLGNENRINPKKKLPSFIDTSKHVFMKETVEETVPYTVQKPWSHFSPRHLLLPEKLHSYEIRSRCKYTLRAFSHIHHEHWFPNRMFCKAAKTVLVCIDTTERDHVSKALKLLSSFKDIEANVVCAILVSEALPRPFKLKSEILRRQSAFKLNIIDIILIDISKKAHISGLRETLQRSMALKPIEEDKARKWVSLNDVLFLRERMTRTPIFTQVEMHETTENDRNLHLKVKLWEKLGFINDGKLLTASDRYKTLLIFNAEKFIQLLWEMVFENKSPEKFSFQGKFSIEYLFDFGYYNNLRVNFVSDNVPIILNANDFGPKELKTTFSKKLNNMFTLILEPYEVVRVYRQLVIFLCKEYMVGEGNIGSTITKFEYSQTASYMEIEREIENSTLLYRILVRISDHGIQFLSNKVAKNVWTRNRKKFMSNITNSIFPIDQFVYMYLNKNGKVSNFIFESNVTNSFGLKTLKPSGESLSFPVKDDDTSTMEEEEKEYDFFISYSNKLQTENMAMAAIDRISKRIGFIGTRSNFSDVNDNFEKMKKSKVFVIFVDHTYTLALKDIHSQESTEYKLANKMFDDNDIIIVDLLEREEMDDWWRIMEERVLTWNREFVSNEEKASKMLEKITIHTNRHVIHIKDEGEEEELENMTPENLYNMQVRNVVKPLSRTLYNILIITD